MKKLGIATLISLTTSAVFASDDIGYNSFVKYRNFGSAKGIEAAPEIILPEPNAGKAIFPSIESSAFSYFSNIGRTSQDSVGYGDWDKLYRVSYGYEHIYSKTKNTSNTYGSRNYMNSFYIHADKKISEKIRLGAGVILGNYNIDYAIDNTKLDSSNIITSWHFLYNNKDHGIAHKSIIYLGASTTDLQRKTDKGLKKSDFLMGYYGIENIVSKKISLANNFYLSPVAEINYYGITREGFSEEEGFSNHSNSSYKIDTGLALYLGYNKDKLSFRAGPDFTSLLSNPKKAYTLDYYNGESLDVKKGSAKDKHYFTWRANFGYKFTDDLAFISDIRYYQKTTDSIMFTLGLNYKF